MNTRSTLTLGLAATLGLSSSALAQQRPNLGQQLERQIINSVENRVLGQPNNPAYNPYQAQRPVYGQPGYQQPGLGYGQPGYQQPGLGYGQPGYQQPGLGMGMGPVQSGYRTIQQGIIGQTPTPRYQLPAQYSNTVPPTGSSIVYNGVTYVINPDGTMSPALSVPPAQRYQLPAQFNGSAPGTNVTYGGATYVVNNDGTMSPSSAATAPASQPVAAAVQRYQIPPQFAGAAPGSTITYGERNYAINNDNTMSPLATDTPR